MLGMPRIQQWQGIDGLVEVALFVRWTILSRNNEQGKDSVKGIMRHDSVVP